MNGLTIDEIERQAIREIEKHRRLRDEAVVLESQIDATHVQEDGREAFMAYVAAMIAVHAQQTVVSTLLGILGYIPEMPTTEVH
jgi:TraR antiactivator